MGFSYTKEQQRVIDIRNANTLVSAAAGSGKTAVLVERILKLITQKDKLINIDELLIVTFTNASAREMKARISDRIEEELEKDLDEKVLVHLHKQITLMGLASITTIHSFCLNIIKTYYHTIDLEPTFRVGEEAEISKYSLQAIDEVLEEYYEQGTDAFLALVECFATGKDDNGLIDLIFSTAKMALTNPWPNKWLDQSLKLIKIEDLEQLYKSEFYKILIEEVLEKLEGAKITLETALEIASMPDGPINYSKGIIEITTFIDFAIDRIKTKDYNELSKLYNNKKFQRLSSTKGCDSELKEKAKEKIDIAKKDMEIISLLVIDEKKEVKRLNEVYNNTKILIELTKAYLERFAKLKKEASIIDFNDFEHFSLDILYTNGEINEIAKSYKDMFYEVLVDEYQDTSEVQETILSTVARSDNMFMVGDLKQSIYKFRLAKPEIFRDKYASFDYKQGSNVKIDLAKNFRSRKEVIEFINSVFEKIMSKKVGDVSYDEKVKLYNGASYYEENNNNFLTEMELVVEHKDYQDLIEPEYVQLAKKIYNMVQNEEIQVLDKELGKTRNIEYKDICVLSRSRTGFYNLEKACSECNIPCNLDETVSFLDAIEVRVVISLLKVIDNPYQDIDLAAVLRSVICNLDEKELLQISNIKDSEGNKFSTLYESCRELLSLELEEVKNLKQKIKELFIKLEELRDISYIKSVSWLIKFIFEKIAYKYFVLFMPRGKERLNKLNELVELAKNFESRKNQGLYEFLEYIDYIIENEIIVKSAKNEENLEGINIMTIHKSKGLEFPVVILVDVQKEFNKMDVRKDYILHQDLGIGLKYVNSIDRYKLKNIFMNAIISRFNKEALSEELRLLYVALTRAKEKLIIMANVKEAKLEKVISKKENVSKCQPIEVMNAKCYMDLILLALTGKEEVVDIKIIDSVSNEDIQKENETTVKDEKSNMLLEALAQASQRKIEENLKLEEMFEPYKYDEVAKKLMSVSVSELKKLKKESKESEKGKAIELLLERKIEPKFKGMSNEISGAEYGTIMHKLLSIIPLEKEIDKNAIKQLAKKASKNGIIDEKYLNIINYSHLYGWVKTDVFKKLVESEKVYREKPFILGIRENGAIRMLQGIIDLYFVDTDGKVILIDYKTDNIKENYKAEFKKRYSIQLEYYQKAIEDITKYKVKQKYVFSLHYGELIEI